MYRRAWIFHKIKAGPASMGGLFALLYDRDIDSVIKPKFENPEYNQALLEESGWNRVKEMFSPGEHGHSTELNSIMQAGFTAGFVGLILGGVDKSKSTFNNFIDTNQASTFQSNFDAKRKLQNQIFSAFGKGGFYLGWRLALFTTYFCGFSTVIAVYRGKSSVFEYSAGGLLTGLIYRIPLGPRGSLIGGLVGGVLGTIAGGVTLLLLRASGKTIEEVRYWQYQMRQNRLDAGRSGQSEDQLLKFRDETKSKDPKLILENEETPVTTN